MVGVSWGLLLLFYPSPTNTGSMFVLCGLASGRNQTDGFLRRLISHVVRRNLGLPVVMHLSCNFVDVHTKLVNVY